MQYPVCNPSGLFDLLYTLTQTNLVRHIKEPKLLRQATDEFMVICCMLITKLPFFSRVKPFVQFLFLLFFLKWT